jgi:hypothetical protein
MFKVLVMGVCAAICIGLPIGIVAIFRCWAKMSIIGSILSTICVYIAIITIMVIIAIWDMNKWR